MSWYQSPHSLKVHCPSPFKAFPSNWKGKGGKIHVRTNDENEKLYSIFIDNLPLAHMWPFQIKIFCHMHIINHLCHSLWSRASTSYGHLVAMVNCYHLMVFFFGDLKWNYGSNYIWRLHLKAQLFLASWKARLKWPNRCFHLKFRSLTMFYTKMINAKK